MDQAHSNMRLRICIQCILGIHIMPLIVYITISLHCFPDIEETHCISQTTSHAEMQNSSSFYVMKMQCSADINA